MELSKLCLCFYLLSSTTFPLYRPSNYTHKSNLDGLLALTKNFVSTSLWGRWGWQQHIMFSFYGLGVARRLLALESFKFTDLIICFLNSRSALQKGSWWLFFDIKSHLHSLLCISWAFYSPSSFPNLLICDCLQLSHLQSDVCACIQQHCLILATWMEHFLYALSKESLIVLPCMISAYRYRAN